MGRPDPLDAALRHEEGDWPVFPWHPAGATLISAAKGGPGLHHATTDPTLIASAGSGSAPADTRQAV
jgi:hypothetical protein